MCIRDRCDVALDTKHERSMSFRHNSQFGHGDCRGGAAAPVDGDAAEVGGDILSSVAPIPVRACFGADADVGGVGEENVDANGIIGNILNLYSGGFRGYCTWNQRKKQ